MKTNIRVKSGFGIAIGSAIGVAVGFAFGRNSSNSMQFIAIGLATGVAIGSVIDFLNKTK